MTDQFKPSALALPSGLSPDMRRFLSAVKQTLEVRTNQLGNPLDTAPTFRDLIDNGLLAVINGASIGGKNFSRDQLLNILTNNIPDWITSDTAPPAPTNLTVTTDKTNTVLRWDQSTFDQYGATEIYRATTNNLSLAVKVGSTSGNEFPDRLPDPGTIYYYWIAHVSKNYVVGAFNSVFGLSSVLAPSAVSVSTKFVGQDLEVSYPTPTSKLAVSQYKIEYLNGVWQTAEITGSNSAKIKADWVGLREFRITPYDINENAGPSTSFQVTVSPPVAPSVSYSFNGERVYFSITPPFASLPIVAYEIFDTSTSTRLSIQDSTSFFTKVTWNLKNFLIRAVDSAGNKGALTTLQIIIQAPSVDSLVTEVIDNFVLFKWTSTEKSLPILDFELRSGVTWATSTLIGKKAGGFTTKFESPRTMTQFTYWLAAIDTAGNYSTPVSATAMVNQPPDYILAADKPASLTGAGVTLVNGVIENGGLVMPINASQSIAQHFTSNSWASPTDQVNAGYPIYIQPGNLSGYYEEIYDYGALLAAMKITVSYLLTVIAGSVSSSVSITTATDAAFTSNVQTFVGTQAFSTNFRYIKIRLDVTATDDKGICTVTDLKYVLDSKLKNIAGMVYCRASDAGGTTVYLTDNGLSGGNKVFVDVAAINLSTQSTTPVNEIYDFVDAPYPLSFKALLFSVAGQRIDGYASYSVKGY